MWMRGEEDKREWMWMGEKWRVKKVDTGGRSGGVEV